MAIGAGKYDAQCTLVREQTQATGVLLLVADGDKGSGFSVQGVPEFVRSLPGILELLAAQIRADLIDNTQDIINTLFYPCYLTYNGMKSRGGVIEVI